MKTKITDTEKAFDEIRLMIMQIHRDNLQPERIIMHPELYYKLCKIYSNYGLAMPSNGISEIRGVSILRSFDLGEMEVEVY